MQMFFPQVDISACTIPPQRPYRCLDLSLGWILIINFERGDVIWYGTAIGRWFFLMVQVCVFYTTPSPSLYTRTVAEALMCVSTNTSVSSSTPVGLIASLFYSPNMLQSTLLQLLLCVNYPPPRTFLLSLSRSVLNSDRGLLYESGLILRQ